MRRIEDQARSPPPLVLAPSFPFHFKLRACFQKRSVDLPKKKSRGSFFDDRIL